MIKINENMSPIQVAEKLIYTENEVENVLGTKRTYRQYNVEELKEIAGHLLTYCKRKENEDDGRSDG